MEFKLGRCRLIEILNEINWKQQTLADYTGINKALISKYANGNLKISYLNSIIITDIINEKTGSNYSPRDLYVILRK